MKKIEGTSILSNVRQASVRRFSETGRLDVNKTMCLLIPVKFYYVQRITGDNSLNKHSTLPSTLLHMSCYEPENVSPENIQRKCMTMLYVQRWVSARVPLRLFCIPFCNCFVLANTCGRNHKLFSRYTICYSIRRSVRRFLGC